jgi:F plasmid transfer operon protein TraF
MPIVSRVVVCRSAFVSFVSFVSFVLTLAGQASAQTTDVIGVRAQGMAGAFTAVADDSTAGFWNPAGLAGGAFANGILEYSRPEREVDQSVSGFSAAYPALGITYYRLPISHIRVEPSTAEEPADREDLDNLRLFAATVAQSIGQHFVLGATIKLLHASDTTGDVDAGVMATFGPLRIGATLKNLFEPTFTSGPLALTLGRHGRVGAAVTSGTRGVVGSATAAVDFDLTTEHPVTGDERFIAVGGEAWAPHNVVGIRGGFRHNTVGLGQTMLSGGVSVALRKNTFVDFYATTGDLVRHGWGSDLRVTF